MGTSFWPWRLLVVGALSLGWLASPGLGESFEMVRDGVPQATIVLDKAPSRAAQLAALELNCHIEKITGARLPIVDDQQTAAGRRILVGASRATEELGLRNEQLKPQEYLIRFLPDALVLMGRDRDDDKQALDYADPATFPGRFDDQATCYAVYDFLERFCGVRWYLPTDVGLVCPRTKSLSVNGQDVRRAPAMKYRELYRAADVPASLSDVPGPRLAEREGRLFVHRQRLAGVQAYACNHAFYGYYNQYLKSHPEWFAKGYDQDMPAEMRKNLGVLGRQCLPYFPNMCYSDAGFIEHVTQRARSFFDTGKLGPSEVGAGDFFSLVPMDSSGQDKFCRCPECQAVLHAEPPCKQWRDHPFFWDDKASDYIFGFVNKVARGVAQTHPGKYLSIAAYHQTYYPPTREPLERNVAVTFTIHAALRPVPAMDRAVKGLLDKWDEESKQRPKYLWLYFHRPGPADPLFPGFMAHHLVRQMEDYHRRGFKGIFAEPAYFPRQGRQEGDAGRAPIVTLLELYLAYKLADDPALDGNKLIDEFFPLFYGAAAEPMRRLYDAIERAYCDPATYATSPATYYGYQTPAITWKRIGTRERMLEFGKLMNEAKEAAETDLEKTRVGLFETSVWNRMKKASMETVGGTFEQMD
jgi:hypothetical protein